MKNFIEVYENTLSKEMCEKIRSFTDLWLSTMSEKRRRGVVMDTKRGSILDKNLKDSYDIAMVLDENSEINNCIRKALLPKINEYKKTHPQINLLPDWRYDNSYNLQKYEPGMAFHYLHCENSTKSSSRIAAWMIYLNTVTDGGGTYFDNYDITMNAVEGRCVIWPAYWTHMHKGIVSKTETKYIATGWISYIDKI